MAKKSNRPRVRPNIKRRVFVILIVAAGVAAGYGFNRIKNNKLFPSPPVSQEQKNKQQAERKKGAPAAAAKPWYKNQLPPPELIHTEAQSIFPETTPGSANGLPGEARRAYEEALPKEIYKPPTVPPAVPAKVPAGKGKKVAPAPSLPAKSSRKNLPRWKKYAVAVSILPNKPKIALVIDDLGIDKPRTRRAIGLTGPLTASFLSYATGLKRQTAAAKKAGHELFLHMSMEPGSTTVDPGPNVLLTGLGKKELLRRLRWGLDSFKGYVGVNNHMGSRFTRDREGMTWVLGELARRGLAFLDSRTSPRTLGAKLARRMGVPYAERNIFIDHDPDPAAIRARLRETERFAERNGVAIAIGHPRQNTLDALEPWLAGVAAKGFQLVPLSAVLRTP